MMRVDVRKSSEITLPKCGFPLAGFMLAGFFFLFFDTLVTVYAFVCAPKIILKRAIFLPIPLALAPAILISQSK